MTQGSSSFINQKIELLWVVAICRHSRGNAFKENMGWDY